MSRADRAIRVSTAVAVLGVAGVAAYVSYWHAFEVVRAHGETGVTARVEPATIDGLVYASSMVILYAARHRLAVPTLARWLLALGIMATLAANVAHGWTHGPVGAMVAAWPAASLVGSYELLLWLIRTAGADAQAGGPDAGQAGGSADQPASGLQLASVPAPRGFMLQDDSSDRFVQDDLPVNGASRTSGPGIAKAGQEDWTADQITVGLSALAPSGSSDDNIDAAAVAAYRTSVAVGRPLSKRKLAAMFGKTSRRWARNRMADACDASEAVCAASR